MAYSTQTLAGGCFGKIYKEKYGDTWAALKRVPIGLISKQQLERECRVYRNARHTNVVRLLGDPWLKDSKWNIPLEFISGEDLETTIFKVQLSKIQLTPAVKATIITGMCEGLLFLHTKDIVHQDLKPDNIMVEHQTHRAVIIDLGLAKFFRNGLSSAVNLGNEAYSAPEILQMNGVRDKRSDVWAMGKIIAELCARIRLPTQFVSPVKIRETLKDQPYCNPVSRMVEPNPNYRSTMAGVIADIRRAPSAQPTDIRPKDITRDITKDVTRDVTKDVTRDVTRDITRDVTRDIKRDITVTHGNDIRPNQKWYPAGPSVPKELNKPQALYYRQSPPQQREMGKAIVPVKGEALNKQLSLMSFPCPLPETGRVTQESYIEENGALVYKEIVTKDGRIVKYEKVQITKDS
ncbi:cyclin-dependent kinase 1-like [Carassius gibelio]|uniref:cyclin-dependent kinase 1-like n=1 Tax=Carassius gibelio TaxID=101364 RepID=UPI002278581A|nr:cyclin-dependent kinase 1-like [Carassius gibelio]